MQRLDEIFDITYGNQLDLNKCEQCLAPEGYNFVNRSSVNCGVSARILPPRKRTSFYPAGSITSAMGGSVLSSFVQQEPFFTGQNVKVLIPKTEMSLSEKLYYCTCIEANRFRFSTFGREANASFDSLIVPSREEIPAKYRNMNIGAFFSNRALTAKATFDTTQWKAFSFSQLFTIRKGKRLTKEHMTAGRIPFIGASDSNNGQTALIGNDKNIHPGNLITVNYNGSIAEAFYQPRAFAASDDVNILYPIHFKLNKYIGLFLCTVIRNEKYRFSYGRKWHKELMEKSVIRLPAGKDGNPDWEYMENYIKGLPYSSNI